MLSVGVVLLVAILCGAIWLDARNTRRGRYPKIEGTLNVSGLAAPMRILRDRAGVPHIRAATEADAWYGLGFVHAQDRLGQMLAARRAARGRSAEVEGPAALEADRWARTLGFARLAAEEAARLSEPVRRVLEAYSAGVNARLEPVRLGNRVAPAGEPDPSALEPWTPTDSLVLLKHRAWTLGASLEESLVLDQLIREFGPTLAQVFFPSRAGRNTAARGGPALPIAWRPPAGPLLPIGWRPPADPLRQRAGHAGQGIGSSAFLVAGSRTRRGAPLLAADAHYPAQAPAELHLAELRGGRLQLAGAAVPGVPIFWNGFNPDLVWAVTHLPAVVTDMAWETLHAERDGRVLDGLRWRKLEEREEVIHVRGAPSQTLLVRETPRGPLVHELLGLQVPVSVRWMGTETSDPMAGFLGLATATSTGKGRRALARHAEPVVAVLLADRHGRGALQVAGALPERALPSGIVPLPSTNVAYGWKRRIPHEALPHRGLTRSRPWLISADGSLPGGRAAGIEMLWRSGARAGRLAKLLRDLRAKPLEEDDLVTLQADARSAVAVDLVRSALVRVGKRPAGSSEAQELIDLLRHWDGDMSAHRVEAAAYHVFLARLARRLFEPELGPELLERLVGLRGMELSWLVGRALDPPAAHRELGAPWSDSERVDAAVLRSLRETWIELAVTLGPNRKKWGWGRLHPLQFLARRPVGRWQRNSAFGPFPLGGDATTVLLGEYSPLDSFDARVVAVHRLIAEAGDLDQALVFLVPGQTEQAGHRWQADGIGRWLRGRPTLLSTRDPVIDDTRVAELRLEPAP
ncbi:MAG: penicillin acylase family protein [Deltaproteobacteria bacterium]|nr:penicillin acylase family protein [Deltaproteobacteria bacterium]MBW2393593.1 penicillin acylase family protein [Deltaproteobacteria bacterium]